MSNGFTPGGYAPQPQMGGYPPQQPPVAAAPSMAKTSGLAIAGLVLSILMCIPGLSLIGLILGIVAAVRIKKQPERLKGMGLAIAAIAVGAFGTLFLAVQLGVGIPAFVKYQQRMRTAEAEDRISEMYRSAVSYYYSEHVNLAGGPMRPQFPVSAGPTPAQRCCDLGGADGRCPVNFEQWDTPTWQALNFAVTDPSNFQYQFVSDGQSFTARAIGDLDCDGIFSTFERAGTATPEGDVEGSRGIFRNLPSE